MTEGPNTLRKSFSLDAVEDHDVILYLAGQDNVSEVIRAALRKYMGQPSQQDVMDRLGVLTQQLEEVLHVIRSGTFVQDAVSSHPVGSQAAQNLEKMMAKWKT